MPEETATQLTPSIVMGAVAYREAVPGYRVRPHTQSTYQWYVVLEGGVDMTVDDEVFTLGPTNSILIPPYALRSPARRGVPPKYLWCVFDNERLHIDRMVRRVLKTPDSLLTDLLELAAELSHRPRLNSDPLVEALVVRLLIGLQRTNIGNDRGTATNVQETDIYRQHVVRRAGLFMVRNLHRRLTRTEIANAVGLSEAHLARLFKDVTGETLVDRLTQMRVQSAKRLLVNSSLPVAEIAFESGYASSSHFNAVFRRHTGMTPSEFRARRDNKHS